MTDIMAQRQDPEFEAKRLSALRESLKHKKRYKNSPGPPLDGGASHPWDPRDKPTSTNTNTNNGNNVPYIPSSATVADVLKRFQDDDQEPPLPLHSYIPKEQQDVIVRSAVRGAPASFSDLPAGWHALIVEVFLDYTLSGGRTKIKVICRRCGVTRAAWDRLIKSRWGPSICRWYEGMVRDMVRFRLGPIMHNLCNKVEKNANVKGVELLAKLTGLLRADGDAPMPVPVQWSRQAPRVPKQAGASSADNAGENKPPDNGPGTTGAD